jgi:hypothetical protein
MLGTGRVPEDSSKEFIETVTPMVLECLEHGEIGDLRRVFTQPQAHDTNTTLSNLFDFYGIVLTVNMTDDELVDLMKQMRRVRQSDSGVHITCAIHGYDEDPRELWELPEVRTFSQRLIDLGFIADLDFAPHWDKELSQRPGQGGLGATEIWLLAAGRLAQTLALTNAVSDEAQAVVVLANRRADELLATSA